MVDGLNSPVKNGLNPGSSRPNTGSQEYDRGGTSPVSSLLLQVVDP
jgi:hypothetical protein